MNHFDVDKALENMTVLIDTREQDTLRLRRRIHDMHCKTERQKLDFGDYSAKCEYLNLSHKVCIERKMNIDELAMCYSKERKRFEREFERAKKAGAKTYLLVENASWEDMYSGKYRSKMTPASLVASAQAWLTRYDCQIVFCRPQLTGRMIHDLLYRELKERLERMLKDEQNSRDN